MRRTSYSGSGQATRNRMWSLRGHHIWSKTLSPCRYTRDNWYVFEVPRYTLMNRLTIGGYRNHHPLRFAILPIRSHHFVQIEHQVGGTQMDSFFHCLYALIKKDSWNLQPRFFQGGVVVSINSVRCRPMNESTQPFVIFLLNFMEQ
jgi:hypothetical protein